MKAMEETSSSSPSPDIDTYTYRNFHISTPSMQSNDNNNNNNSTRARTNYSSFLLSTFRFLQAPLSTLLTHHFPNSLLPQNPNSSYSTDTSINNNNEATEVSIQIIPRQERNQIGSDGELGQNESSSSAIMGESSNGEEDDRVVSSNGNSDASASRPPSSYQNRYDLQQAAKLIEHIILFCLLLLIVLIRQHLQGFFVTIYITAFLFKSNDIVKKQTALKGERKLTVLVGYFMVFMLHVIGIYWWYRNDDISSPLIMVPPTATPPFWHALFTILVNDTMVRQASMAFKLILLAYHRNGKGHNFRRQGQLLTLVEYTLLLYRALLPAPVWYRFFLNKDYGSLFSSLTTGMYLTSKLTSVVEKVRSFFSALKSLSRKEIHYGSYVTLEQVKDAGDLCAICQEKMHVPVLLCCKHVFCEDCVSEWFERERTCPLCRALVRPADMWSYGDGSTSLFIQLY